MSQNTTIDQKSFARNNNIKYMYPTTHSTRSLELTSRWCDEYTRFFSRPKYWYVQSWFKSISLLVKKIIIINETLGSYHMRVLMQYQLEGYGAKFNFNYFVLNQFGQVGLNLSYCKYSALQYKDQGHYHHLRPPRLVIDHSERWNKFLLLASNIYLVYFHNEILACFMGVLAKLDRPSNLEVLILDGIILLADSSRALNIHTFNHLSGAGPNHFIIQIFKIFLSVFFPYLVNTPIN